MTAKFHLILISTLTLFSSSSALVPQFAFSWLDDKDVFKAGETATIKIKVLGNFDSKANASLNRTAFNPFITVNGKTGNSSYISGVFLDINGDPSTWQIVFVPILAGLFNVIINDDPFKVMDSSLHFTVEPGPVYPSVSVASWLAFWDEFEAGSTVPILILLKDAFGNNITSTDKEPSSYNISVTALHENGSVSSLLNITSMAWNEFGYIIMEFMVVIAGNFLLNIQGANQTLNGSPLPFKVNPGPLDVSNCAAKWRFEFNAWQIFSKMEILVYQQDRYRNLVPGLYEFDADVIEEDTNLSIPVTDLQFEEVEPGVQLFSFSMSKAGNFLLTISDMKHNKSISYMPFAYTVFVGYCDGVESIVNGTGLNTSVSGEVAQFSVYLRDAFQYPSPVEVERLQVEIERKIDSTSVLPTIYPTQISNGELPDIATSETKLAPVPSTGLNNTSPRSLTVWATAFNVMYTPQKSGIYRIYVFCGNIILNDGSPFTKEVKPGTILISVSGVVKFAPKAPKLVRNEIVVQLMDLFSNPVVSETSKLRIVLTSVEKPGFSTWMFVDNNDGSYIGHYLAMEVGTYEMCVLFEGNHFSPCPFAINVYGSEYFPKAYDDIISLWEDESIAFDVLENDYFAGANASVVEFSKPIHGSLLQYGMLFRYTPYKDYFGNDSFLYTISNINGDLATATVKISVLTIPPQFVSFPSQLQATEDLISPRFGGYNGFELKYSDPTENISVILSAMYGTIFLSTMSMQFWQPIWSEFSVNKGDEKGTNLTIEGRLEVINFSLQSIQYLGNGNFSGNDTLRVSARNRNGVNDLDVQVVVDPINDPPYVNVPEFIVLKNTRDESLLFNKETDRFPFSIGDPDVLNVTGGESGFELAFSMEVSDGYLLATLPAALVDSTELKSKNSYQWQPLQTYVTISKQFVVRAIGIRFRASIIDCNTVMQHLSYYGGGHDAAVLTVKVNDLGRYGCHSDCIDRITKPLVVEATVNLIKGKPMSSSTIRTLESVIVIEFILVFSLGLMMVFFTCKCVILLVNEIRRQSPRNSEPIEEAELADKNYIQFKTWNDDPHATCPGRRASSFDNNPTFTGPIDSQNRST
ncbi:protein GAMETE EXPRESSED 2-like [Hibiscus syriacus]|uniref:protein GAMETE EXPRESSED 2-like n=1 Tax=Hibiscus syriacus TaxID=106335 RepID=UPI001921ED27|nr:protein GAMETE EXPRESSED 2-like [Hibiscus syriacus]